MVADVSAKYLPGSAMMVTPDAATIMDKSKWD
jgi:hypothetical protein